MKKRLWNKLFILSFLVFPWIFPLPVWGEQMQAVLHVHSKASGPHPGLEELSIRAMKKGIDAVILTDYLRQQVDLGWHPLDRWLKVSYSLPSIHQFGFEKYYDAIKKINKKHPHVLLIPGAEALVSYWWSGNLFKGTLTLHNTQKNILVFRLSPGEMKRAPTVPNRLSESDAYHGDAGERPYQQMFDYVKQHNGFVIWSTPDENPNTNLKFGPIQLKTDTYTSALMETQEYDGIGIFPEGFAKTGIAGGMWDKVLKDYCRGKRARPPWAFAELIMHEDHPIEIDQRLNVAYVPKKTREELFRAFRDGNFYALDRGSGSRIILEDFQVDGYKGSAHSGGTLLVKDQVIVRAVMSSSDAADPAELELKLIKMGKVVKTVKGKNLIRLNYQETASDLPHYYFRIEGRSKSIGLEGILVSNPIFIKTHETN